MSEDRNSENIFKRIFRENWTKFKQLLPSYDSAQYNEPVSKMLNCGSEGCGYATYLCMNCGKDERRICFTCKGGYFCLSCAKKYVDEFVARVRSQPHPGIRYRHVMLTIPEQLRLLFFKFRHSDELLSEFMRCGHICLEDVLKTLKRKSLKVGAVIVVQTYGRSGGYNPHLHIIMTSGGVNEELGNCRIAHYIGRKPGNFSELN